LILFEHATGLTEPVREKYKTRMPEEAMKKKRFNVTAWEMQSRDTNYCQPQNVVGGMCMNRASTHKSRAKYL
jgi:hypothetical protein